ncbi:MAG: hypothetical protein FWF12_04250 [Betaproteobacteria bacterium]|nr:hypothetical protein [Betaproteobacteria bacterium]
MNLSDSQISEKIKPFISHKYLADAIAYLDTQPKKMGESILVGREKLSMPFAGYFIFVDLVPMANWGHPSLGIFVSMDGTQTENTPLRFPPFFGKLPAHYRKLKLS